MQPAVDVAGVPAAIVAPVAPPLVVHVIHQLGIGGLENGLVNLINLMPASRYRHAIVCLTDASDFQARIKTPGVDVICLHKRAGKDWPHYLRLYRALRALRPALVHTRNLVGIEGQLLAALAGVKLRVHGEHGRDMADLHGQRTKYRVLRRLMAPLVSHFITVSGELARWLVAAVGVAPARVTTIGNGVDSLQFHPRLGPAAALGPPGFLCQDAFVIGSVGRMAQVKDHATLVQAFILLVTRQTRHGRTGNTTGTVNHAPLRLLIVGDGPCRAACQAQLAQAGLADLAWLPGARDDIAQLMRIMDLFVLPSLAEGSSNTILEAMASGLPVVATAVGGNVELVEAGWSGTLVPPMAPQAMADAIDDYVRIAGLAQRHGARGRRRVLAEHSLLAMSNAYLAVYDGLLSSHLPTPP